MSQLVCRLGRLGRLGTDGVPQIIANGEIIAAAFAKASSVPGSLEKLNIIVDNRLSQDIDLYYWKSGPIRAYDLQEALTNLVGRSDHMRTSGAIAVLYATTYAPRQDLLGIMFDSGFVDDATTNPLDPRAGGDRAPREGAAVFLDRIKAVAADDYNQQVIFTTIHEIGHTFNLEHVQGPPTNYMTQGGGRSYDPETCTFTEAHMAKLHGAASDPNTWPGRSPFSHIENYDYWAPIENTWGEARAPVFGLDLRLSVARASFQYFEPIELEVTLSVAPGLEHNFRVPDCIDPGYKTFRLWIEGPDGERRIYRSPRRYCWQSNWLTVSHRRPFSRDISFFGQSGGYTFRRAGVHSVWAEFALGKGKVVRSPPLELEIRSLAVRDPIAEDRAFFTARRSRVLLYHRLDRDDGKTLQDFEKWLDERSIAATQPSVRYAIGRALVERAENSREDRHGAKKLAERAQEHLQKAAGSDDLGQHQRAIAEQLLSDRLLGGRRQRKVRSGISTSGTRVPATTR